MALRVSGGQSEEDGAAAEPSLSGARVVDVKDRYEIDSAKPLPDLDAQPAVAYACIHKRDSKRSLFALVCDPKLPPRLDVVGILRRIDHRNMLRPLDWDIVDWAPEGRRCPVVIAEKPPGKRIFPDLKTRNDPLPEEYVTRHFLEPVCQILREMHALGTYHRAIRPDNLFWLDGGGREMMIGECFASQPGMTNPVAYETLECALASVAGRGEGGAENDLFAVGVTALALLTGRSPMAEAADEEVVKQRLIQGSYGALAQQFRVSLTMMEPLRGLLNDDPKERWTIEDLAMWLNGRRLTPKQQAMPTKGSRGLTIGGEDYFTGRTVAYGLHRNWDQAAIVINSGTLDIWLRRSLGEEQMVEAVNLAKAGCGDNQDKLVARVLIALDPDGPIRLRAFSATVQGIATLVGAFAEDAEARQLFASVISMNLHHFWMEQRRGLMPSELRHINRLDKMKVVLNQTTLGFGFERAVYELNEETPCLSPLFERDYVLHVEHSLPALERLSMGEGRTPHLIDRHVAAFLAARFKRPIGGELRDIDRAPDEEDGRIAQVRILATLQEALHRDIAFPALGQMSAKLLEPAVFRFHSKERRRDVRGRLRKAAKSGRLQDLLDIVDDTQEVSKDQNEFALANARYVKTVNDLIALMQDIHNKPRLAEEIGGQLSGTAAVLGCVGTVVLASFTVFF